MHFRFYSRRTGYPEGMKINYFHTKIINDPHNESLFLVDKSAHEILKLSLPFQSPLFNEIQKLAKIFNTWYYYPDGTEITPTSHDFNLDLALTHNNPMHPSRPNAHTTHTTQNIRYQEPLT